MTLASLSEAQFLDMIVTRAKARGWLVMHTRPARTERGWRTPLQGDAGFPDLILARRGQLVMAELKTAKGRLTDAQADWYAALQTVEDRPKVTVDVWRPGDWPSIVDLIDGESP